MKLIIATHNPHKIEEFVRILEPMGITACTAELTEAAETGKTFLENAYLKAKSACEETGLPCVADDSGLCVDALGGAPGIYSARYAEPGQRKATILEKLKGLPKGQRGAQFVSAIVCVFPEGTVLRAEGICPGSITTEPQGVGGFGYDPIFLAGDKTFAQRNDAEKDAISHRGIALREFEKQLKSYLEKEEKNDK